MLSSDTGEHGLCRQPVFGVGSVPMLRCVRGRFCRALSLGAGPARDRPDLAGPALVWDPGPVPAPPTERLVTRCVVSHRL